MDSGQRNCGQRPGLTPTPSAAASCVSWSTKSTLLSPMPILKLSRSAPALRRCTRRRRFLGRCVAACGYSRTLRATAPELSRWGSHCATRRPCATLRRVATFFMWGAIAYSERTGKCGWAARHFSEKAAESAALAWIDEPDAEVIATCRGSAWIALACGDDGSWALGKSDSFAFASKGAAELDAFKQLETFQTSGGRRIVCSVAGWTD